MMTRLQEREALIRFFVERTALRVNEAANLLGCLPSALRFEARGEGALLPGDRIAWEEMAFRLLQAWPRAWLLETLSVYSRFIPSELHLTEVKWRLPLYIVRALERQAALERRRRSDMQNTTVDDCVADALHLAIDDETLATFREDGAFLEAFDYPGGAGDEDGAGL